MLLKGHDKGGTFLAKQRGRYKLIFSKTKQTILRFQWFFSDTREEVAKIGHIYFLLKSSVEKDDY